VASLVMIVFSVISALLPDRHLFPDQPDAASIIIGGSVFAALLSVGAILAIRRPRNAIGWLFLVSGFGFVLSIFSTEYVGRADVLGANLPAVEVIAWLGAWWGQLAIGLAVIFIPLLFPDGRPPGPRWWIFAWVAGLILVGATLLGSVQPEGTGGLPILLVLGILAILSLAIRFHRSRGIERQQLKWFLLAVGVFLTTLIVGIVTELDVVWYGVQIAFASLPIAAAIAVLRYRLYEIDRIISRTLAYGIVTATLAVVFVGAIIGLQAILAQFTGANTVAVAASTLVVAALFQPLRRRVQHIVDRRFDRARYDGERVADSFAKSLRDEVDIDRLRAALVSTAEEAVRPNGASIWLRPTGRES
jgi:hypothetical protein